LTDESYIRLTLELARKGKGRVSPNPLVGAVIVKNGKIIGVGYHEYFGGPHAEINAINNVKEDLEGAELYVNLEPCSHFGKTPPCVDEIIKRKFKRVVIGTYDMNPLVCGKGAQKLIDAGIEVKVGVLENECYELNKFFFNYIVKNIPYIAIKAAITLDGKIADNKKYSKWISGIYSRQEVHNLRSEYDAVLVGANTVKIDDPKLTVRFCEGRNPIRVIIDKDLSLSLNYKVFQLEKPGQVIILARQSVSTKKEKIKKLQSLGVDLIFVKENAKGELNLKFLLKELAKKRIASLLIEGGSKVYTSFIKQQLFDEILLFISPKLLGLGIPFIDDIGISSLKKALQLEIKNFKKIGDDIFIELKKK